MPITWRRLALISWDAIAWLLAISTFALTRYDWQLTNAQWAMVLVYAALAVTGQILAGLVTQHYLGRSRIGSFTEASWTATIVLVIAFPLFILFNLVDSEIPRGVTMAAPPIALVIMGGARWLFRSLIDARPKNAFEGSVPALVYGAGNAGLQVIQLMNVAEEPPYQIVGLIDDDPSKKHLRLRGVKVMGPGANLAKIAQDTGAEVVILAVTDASPQLMEELNDTCIENGLELLVVPPVREMIGGQVTIGAIRHLNVADLLGRRPIETRPQLHRWLHHRQEGVGDRRGRLHRFRARRPGQPPRPVAAAAPGP